MSSKDDYMEEKNEDLKHLSNKDLLDLKALTEQTLSYYTAVLKADLPPGNREQFEIAKRMNEEELVQ